ncbi:MAG: methionyl aminopeptidase [Candidatus Tokpelaia sp. JSC161]|jgi:methionyl aminopeptidase|nr:MAG: methionyl aminopeptidase [Candidatus Tokpelaia sp. JSC161]
MISYISYRNAPLKYTGEVRIFDEQAFQGMRKVCNLAARCLDELAELVKPGMTTKEIDSFVFSFGVEHGALPADLNYRGYTASCCTSINHVVCHGIPDNKPLREGDILNIDVTYILDGWHGDTGRMYSVGKIKRAAERLIEVTHECLMRGIASVKPGIRTGTIGAAIQQYAEAEHCSVVRDFCGHGVGQIFHDAPSILHYGTPDHGIELREGMIFTIEPMINLGKAGVKILKDGWTAVTRDRSLSAQYEHTVAVTKTGYEIFTL